MNHNSLLLCEFSHHFLSVSNYSFRAKLTIGQHVILPILMHWHVPSLEPIRPSNLSSLKRKWVVNDSWAYTLQDPKLENMFVKRELLKGAALSLYTRDISTNDICMKLLFASTSSILNPIKLLHDEVVFSPVSKSSYQCQKDTRKNARKLRKILTSISSNNLRASSIVGQNKTCWKSTKPTNIMQ